MQKQSPFFIIFVFVVLIVLAAALRFYHLGTWSFGLDEIATQIETRLFFENQPLPISVQDHPCHDPDLTKSQFYRLPQLIFASHFVHWIDYRLFGDDEFGSRVLMAVMGSLSVGLAFLLGRSLFGFSGSLILALLILLSPEHILQSQNARFSIQAFLSIEIVLLLGGHVAMYRSIAAALWLGPAAVIMVLSHSLAGIIWEFLLIGLLIDFLLAERQETENNLFGTKIPRKIVFILGSWSIILLLIAAFHVLPLTESWNNWDAKWKTSSVNNLLRFIYNFGWAYFLLFVPAWFFVVSRFRKAGQSYWVFCAAACGAAVFLLPLKMSFQVWYNFLFMFPFFVILSIFIHKIGCLITESDFRYGRYCGIMWCCFAVILNFPALNGYYKDGGRYDFRSACRYIAQYYQPDDQLACRGHGGNGGKEIIHRYLPKADPLVLAEKVGIMEESLQRIRNKMKKGERLWIILAQNSYSEKTHHWLDKYAEYKTSFGTERYDRSPMYLEVFIVQPEPLTQ